MNGRELCERKTWHCAAERAKRGERERGEILLPPIEEGVVFFFSRLLASTTSSLLVGLSSLAFELFFFPPCCISSAKRSGLFPAAVRLGASRTRSHARALRSRAEIRKGKAPQASKRPPPPTRKKAGRHRSFFFFFFAHLQLLPPAAICEARRARC